MGQRIYQTRFLRIEAELEALQERIARRVIIETRIERLDLIAGCDAVYRGDTGYAVVALFSYPSLEILEVVRAKIKVDFPYIPGFFAFRESPLVIAALNKLKNRPHCLIADGHGVAHPRGAGLASHLGIATGIPAIGCAKTRLIGYYTEPDLTKGSISPLVFEGKPVGYVVRTRSGVKPVFVSPGHLVDHETAVEVLLNCCISYRTPEPLRIAHIESRRTLPKTES